MTASIPTHVSRIDADRFIKFLKDAGAEILPHPENIAPYEVVRYRWAGSISILYKNERGRLRWYGDCATHYLAMLQRKNMSVSNGRTRLKSEKKFRLCEEIRERDGDGCWLCSSPMEFPDDGLGTQGNEATIEHLWPASRGGPNILGNLVLCCYECNQQLGDLSLVEKIKLRDTLRRKM